MNDDCDQQQRPTTPEEKQRLRSVSFAEIDEERQQDQNSGSDILPYQCFLFLLTQIGYMAVVPSLLTTTFFEPSEDFCKNHLFLSNRTETTNDILSSKISDDLIQKIYLNDEFYSLLFEWNKHCRATPWTFWISTSLMVGGIFGSFGAGFFADRLGRKPVVVSSMIAICFGNFSLVLTANFNQFVTLFVFFMIGMACGGYLVTNMVLLVEILRNSSTRLLVVSLNGWPLGMIGTAFLAYILRHWRMYHLVIGVISAIFSLILQYFAFESIPWLIQSGKDGKAQLIQQRLIRINSMLSLTKENGNEAKRNDGLVNFLNSRTSPNSDEAPVYTYLDLFRHRSISIRLITLLFCFGSSSIISFGLYFSAEVLPGSRYLNIAIMGLNKLALGFLPFLLSNCMGRRPILLSSIGLAMLAAWGLIISKFVFEKHFIITALGLFITGAIDPNWKIIHLLSIELFPTPVRNMARALCNVVARLGSLSGPWVLFLRPYSESLPFWIFAVLLTIQLAISFLFLPETHGKPLPDQMPIKEDEMMRKFRHRTLSRHSIRSAHSVDFAIA